MFGPFAPDPLDERIVSLPAEIQGERLHAISLMYPSARKQLRPARPSRRVSQCLLQDWERRDATHVAVSTRPAGDGV